MIKILNRLNSSKNSSQSLHSVISYFASSSLQTTTYPYTFGGLKNVQFTQNQASLVTIRELFDQDTLQGFKEAYKFTLYSLAQKDKQSLQNICQPHLTKNINWKNVELVNPDASIEVVCGISFKAFGANFIRQSTTELKSMPVDESTKFYLNLGLMNPSNPSSLMKHMAAGLPILLGYEVLFRSTMKLVPQGGPRNEKIPEIHSIQFQVEGKMNVMKYMKLAMGMSAGKSNINYDEAKNILKEMIGSNFEWKIGDIDHALNGNLNVIA